MLDGRGHQPDQRAQTLAPELPREGEVGLGGADAEDQVGLEGGEIPDERRESALTPGGIGGVEDEIEAEAADVLAGTVRNRLWEGAARAGEQRNSPQGKAR